MTVGPTEISPSGKQLFPAEKLVILSIALFSVLILADCFVHNNKNLFLIPVSLLVILIFWWLPEGRQRFSESPLLVFIFSSFSLIGYAYLYKLAGALVNFLSNRWQDEVLVWLDRAIFGFSPNLAIVSYQQVWLTELMLFAYMAYLPLVVWLAWMVFRIHGQDGLQSYLLTLGLAYMTCFLLFIIIPAASPRFYFSELRPAEGLLLRRLMNLVEVSAQYRGGSFPSAHCAAGTVMIYFAWRARRKVFLIVAPMIILFFFSTIYGQYHYGVDVLAGIVIGLLAVLASKSVRLKKPARSRSRG
jgi:membrane-associated phospholipid phosphatase